MKAEDSVYYHKVILAPMVRICGAGFRDMCASHGAGVVFTEEVVAAKLAQCEREIVTYPTVPHPMADYVTYDAFKNAFKRSLALSTPARCSGDKAAKSSATLILQLGAACPDHAAAAARRCSGDVDGIDLNMGCPKKFSVTNGFGAALMNKTVVAGGILRAVHDAVGPTGVTVSFKTRLKETAAATVDMLTQILESAGHLPTSPVVHAITLHARTRDQRAEEAPLYERAAEVVAACRALPLFAGICFVLNGSLLSREDGEAKGRRYGFDGWMLARSALEDAHCFAVREAPPSAYRTNEEHCMAVMKELLFYSVRYRCLFQNFKYHLTRAFPEVPALKPKMNFVQTELRSYEDCFTFFGLSEEEKKLLRSCFIGTELFAEKPTPSKLDASSLSGQSTRDENPAAKRQRVET